MTEIALAVSATCVVQVVEAAFEPVSDGWLESTRLEIVADPSCGTIDLSLPPGAVLGEHLARQRLGDGTHGKLGEERWEQVGRAVDGSGWVRLHVPELLSGDRVLVDLERRLPPGPVVFRPGPARYVDVTVAGDAVAAADGRSDRRITADRTGTTGASTIRSARVP